MNSVNEEPDVYPKYTKKEREYLTEGLLEKEVNLTYGKTPWLEVDPDEEPYRQVYVGNEDGGT